MSRVEDMSCKEVVELITEYLDGSLTGHDVPRFEAHLNTCEGCVNYLGQMRTTIELTGRLDEESLAPEVRTALIEAFRDWRSHRTL
jgi:predicted anti-sigma-YlaC factor YlaD